MTDIVERLRAAAYADEKDAKRHDEALATAPGSYASDFRQWRDEELASAALAREAAAEIERLRGLLKTFAVYYEINDLDERLADDAIEVPVGDLRAVYRVIGARAAQMDGEG